MDQEFLLYYAVAVLSLSLVFLAAVGIVRRLMARNFLRMAPNTKRNALTYALHVVDDDEGSYSPSSSGFRSASCSTISMAGRRFIPVLRNAIRLLSEKNQSGQCYAMRRAAEIEEFNRNP